MKSTLYFPTEKTLLSRNFCHSISYHTVFTKNSTFFRQINVFSKKSYWVDFMEFFPHCVNNCVKRVHFTKFLGRNYRILKSIFHTVTTLQLCVQGKPTNQALVVRVLLSLASFLFCMHFCPMALSHIVLTSWILHPRILYLNFFLLAKGVVRPTEWKLRGRWRQPVSFWLFSGVFEVGTSTSRLFRGMAYWRPNNKVQQISRVYIGCPCKHSSPRCPEKDGGN